MLRFLPYYPKNDYRIFINQNASIVEFADLADLVDLVDFPDTSVATYLHFFHRSEDSIE
jgi:hypothetical protein